jgi:hypothetical protein
MVWQFKIPHKTICGLRCVLRLQRFLAPVSVWIADFAHMPYMAPCRSERGVDVEASQRKKVLKPTTNKRGQL